ncbi:hypothetical protein SprV_0501916600 [Sparganum proliferum]
MADWSVRSHLDNPRSNRPEWRTILVSRELVRYKVDITAIKETRFSEQGQLEEVDVGYTSFWSDCFRSERRDAGVAFALQNNIVERLPWLPQGIDNRLMSPRPPLCRSHFATISSAYAPPVNGPDKAKNNFYEDAHVLLTFVSKSDKLIVLGDLNARVRTDCAALGGNAGYSRNRRLQRQCPPFPANLRCTPPSSDQHILPPAASPRCTADRYADSCWTTFSSDGAIDRT